MNRQQREVIDSQVQEILNYFGKCPLCGHPARAWHITATFADHRTESQDIAECGGWCGWKAPTHPTTMTPGALVLAQGSGVLSAVNRTNSRSDYTLILESASATG
ncbi:hypothetical protein [Nocardia sp. NPDC004722]